MTNVSPAGIAILQSAAAAKTGAIDKPQGAHQTIASLIKRGLLIALPSSGRTAQLQITDAGRAIVAESSGGEAPVSPSGERAELQSNETAEAPTGKIGMLVALLRRPGGARLDEMTGATGWQAHSVRGAISGGIKKRLGLTVLSELSAEGRVYRIPGDAA